MKFSLPSIFFLVSSTALADSAATAGPTVSLPYARYEGLHDSTSGLDVFLGIRYAQAPVGDLRWRAPKPPVSVGGTLQATSQPIKCSQPMVSANASFGPPDLNSAEDCLFLNVYAPPLNASKKPLPVLVWIHGGAYLVGDAASYDPTYMIQASNLSFVAVVIQYRLGVFGFLPGSEIKANGALNAGHLDVQFALKWTQENIHLFGGDPDQVTIWGESAGAGAVLTQVVANGGKTSPPLFNRGIASSPYIPSSYRYNDPESELQYTTLVNNTGCTNAVDTLECLRGLNQAILIAENNQVPPVVIDGTFLTQRAQLSLAKKQANSGRLISLHNGDEGRLIVARKDGSTVRSRILEQFPRLSQDNITAIESAYSSFASNNVPEPDNVYKLQTLIIGEAVIVCSSVWLASAGSESSYKGLFDVAPALHGLDVAVYFPSMRSFVVQPVHPISESLTQSFMGALLSFILTGSPNENHMNQNINPGWATYDPKYPEEMIFNVTTTGIADPQFEQVDSGLLERCSLWAELAPVSQQ